MFAQKKTTKTTTMTPKPPTTRRTTSASMVESLEGRQLFSVSALPPATLATDDPAPAPAEAEVVAKVTVHDISFTQKVNKSSPALAAPMKITLTDVLISSYN
jgi:hypothetical protein